MKKLLILAAAASLGVSMANSPSPNPQGRFFALRKPKNGMLVGEGCTRRSGS